MARVPALNDGQPLTYELINKIIEKIGSIKEPREDQSQNIEILGPRIGRTEEDKVKIVVGTHAFNLSGNAVNQNEKITFKNSPFSKVPFVVASIIDIDGKKNPDANMPTVVITGVDQAFFEAKVFVLKAKKKNVPLQISYMAIGPGK